MNAPSLRHVVSRPVHPWHHFLVSRPLTPAASLILEGTCDNREEVPKRPAFGSHEAKVCRSSPFGQCYPVRQTGGAFLLRSVVNTSDVVSGGNVVALNAIASETL